MLFGFPRLTATGKVSLEYRKTFRAARKMPGESRDSVIYMLEGETHALGHQRRKAFNSLSLEIYLK